MPDTVAEIAAYLVEASLVHRTDATSLRAVLAQRWPRLTLGDLQAGFALARAQEAAQAATEVPREPDMLDAL